MGKKRRTSQTEAVYASPEHFLKHNMQLNEIENITY